MVEEIRLHGQGGQADGDLVAQDLHHRAQAAQHLPQPAAGTPAPAVRGEERARVSLEEGEELPRRLGAAGQTIECPRKLGSQGHVRGHVPRPIPGGRVARQTVELEHEVDARRLRVVQDDREPEVRTRLGATRHPCKAQQDENEEEASSE